MHTPSEMKGTHTTSSGNGNGDVWDLKKLSNGGDESYHRNGGDKRPRVVTQGRLWWLWLMRSRGRGEYRG